MEFRRQWAAPRACCGTFRQALPPTWPWADRFEAESRCCSEVTPLDDCVDVADPVDELALLALARVPHAARRHIASRERISGVPTDRHDPVRMHHADQRQGERPGRLPLDARVAAIGERLICLVRVQRERIPEQPCVIVAGRTAAGPLPCVRRWADEAPKTELSKRNHYSPSGRPLMVYLYRTRTVYVLTAPRDFKMLSSR